MSPIEHDGKQYRVVRGSDIQRDGMFLEMWSAVSPDTQLLEIFHSDVTNRMHITAFSNEEIPIEVVEELLRRAHGLLPLIQQPAEPGSPGNAAGQRA